FVPAELGQRGDVEHDHPEGLTFPAVPLQGPFDGLEDAEPVADPAGGIDRGQSFERQAQLSVASAVFLQLLLQLPETELEFSLFSLGVRVVAHQTPPRSEEHTSE